MDVIWVIDEEVFNKTSGIQEIKLIHVLVIIQFIGQYILFK